MSELSVKKINRDYCISLLGDMFNKGPLPSIVGGVEGETNLTSEEIAAGFSVSKLQRKMGVGDEGSTEQRSGFDLRARKDNKRKDWPRQRTICRPLWANLLRLDGGRRETGHLYRRPAGGPDIADRNPQGCHQSLFRDAAEETGHYRHA